MIWRWLDFCENRCCANCFEGQPMRRVQFAAKANSLFDISSKKRHLSTRWGKRVRQVQNSTRNLIFYIELVPYDFRFSRKSAILLLLAEASGTLRAPDVWHTQRSEGVLLPRLCLLQVEVIVGLLSGGSEPWQGTVS